MHFEPEKVAPNAPHHQNVHQENEKLFNPQVPTPSVLSEDTGL